MEPFATIPSMQGKADSAYARYLWWDAQKVMIEKLDIKPSGDGKIEDIGDYVVKEFIKRCEEGFFDVKPTEGK